MKKVDLLEEVMDGNATNSDNKPEYVHRGMVQEILRVFPYVEERTT